MTQGGGRQPGHGGGPERLACFARAFALRELCRAACGRWGAGATFAQQNGDSDAPGTRQSQGLNRPGRVRNDLFPVFPVKRHLFPVRPGTVFPNGDKGLGHFPGIVPGVPYKSSRDPEADHPKTHAQTPRRPAALARVATVRPVHGGRGVPPSGPSGAFAHTGNSHHVQNASECPFGIG